VANGSISGYDGRQSRFFFVARFSKNEAIGALAH